MENKIKTFWGAHGSGTTTAMVKYAYMNLMGRKQIFITNDKYNICTGNKLEILAKLNDQEFKFIPSIEDLFNDTALNDYDEVFIKLYFKQPIENSFTFGSGYQLNRSNNIFIVSVFMVSSNELLDRWNYLLADEIIVTYADVLPMINRELRKEVILTLIDLSKIKIVWLSSGADLIGNFIKATETMMMDYLGEI